MARRAPLPAPGREGLASAKCFALGLCVVALPLAFEAAWSGVGGRVASVVYLALVNAGLLVAYRGRHDLYQVRKDGPRLLSFLPPPLVVVVVVVAGLKLLPVG